MIRLGRFLTFVLSIAVWQRSCVDAAADVYSFTVQDVYGKTVSLERYRGYATLVVNVASDCGYTADHYKSLVELQRELVASQHFSVLAFPCNQFWGQEPKENEEILSFVRSTYNINFPLFAKVDVKGEDASPLWKHIGEVSSVPSWNFWKYLVNHDGRVIGAWGPRTSVDEIAQKISDAVNAAKVAQSRGEL